MLICIELCGYAGGCELTYKVFLAVAIYDDWLTFSPTGANYSLHLIPCGGNLTCMLQTFGCLALDL